jgi:Fur family transcriptional regulator, ferric uptake regulator
MYEKAKKSLSRGLKDNGYSVTIARQKVFDLLWNQEPQTMYDLYKRSKGSVDRASIYRTINLFLELGMVQKIIIGWKYKLELTDIFTHHHHHISCLKCGKIMAIREDEHVEELIHNLAEKYGITAERHQLEIQGYCKSCRQSPTVKSAD